ncbi:unnamed protein product [Trichobilharzia szidati]|nr:unnamed protein product [Trichobilharzia szidati]
MNSEPIVSSEPTTTVTADDENMSKRKRRKLEKYLKSKEARRDARKAQKQRRKMRQNLLKQNIQSSQATVVNDAHDTNNGNSVEDSSNTVDCSVSQKPVQQRRIQKMSESKCQTKVVIDCAYDHLMSFKDICKLAQQVTKCYSINRRAEHPVQLYITGLGSSEQSQCIIADNHNGGNNSKEKSSLNIDISKCDSVRLLDKLKLCDCDNWDVNLCEENFQSMFSANEIVYLCAESENILPDHFESSSSSSSSEDASIGVTDKQDNHPVKFSVNDVYVIGGLIDHNSLKGYCYRQACEQGYRTARLPLKEIDLHIEGRHVLSTVHVFQALCPVLSGTKTWLESLKLAIPPRKLTVTHK